MSGAHGEPRSCDTRALIDKAETKILGLRGPEAPERDVVMCNVLLSVDGAERMVTNRNSCSSARCVGAELHVGKLNEEDSSAVCSG